LFVIRVMGQAESELAENAARSAQDAAFASLHIENKGFALRKGKRRPNASSGSGVTIYVKKFLPENRLLN
jgi:hypothetical protein